MGMRHGHPHPILSLKVREMSDALDAKYLALISQRIEVCLNYLPQFGQGKSVTRQAFERLYGHDVFYAWFGLDHPLIYAAHKTAGGITSLYRQIGIGCEQLFRQILMDQLGLSDAQSKWSYSVIYGNSKPRTLYLDGRIELENIVDTSAKNRVSIWMHDAAEVIGVNPVVASVLRGVVFEVRQGYKSKDSKRQNADIGNAAIAYSQGYLPVIVILSDQIDSDVAERYMKAGWLLLRGILNDNPCTSTFNFVEQVLGYDLAGFFSRNAPSLKQTVILVLEALLSPDHQPDSTYGVSDADESPEF